MTLEDLLNMSADKLCQMTDEELNTYCTPYYHITRPELAPKPVNGIRPVQPVMSFKEKQDVAKLQELGIDVSHLFTAKRRKK